MSKFDESKLNIESLLLVVKTKKEKETLKQEISDFLLKHPQDQKVKIADIQKNYPVLCAVLLSQKLDLDNFIEQKFLDLIKEEINQIEEVEIFLSPNLKEVNQQRKEGLIQILEGFVKGNICKNFLLDINEEKNLSGGIKIVYKGHQQDLSLENIIRKKLKSQKS